MQSTKQKYGCPEKARPLTVFQLTYNSLYNKSAGIENLDKDIISHHDAEATEQYIKLWVGTDW